MKVAAGIADLTARCVTTVTQAVREPGDTMIVEVVRGSGPAVRRAIRNANRAISRAARRPTRTRRCRRPHRAHGPPSRETNPQRPRPETDAAVETRCCPWRPSRTSATRSSACRPSRAGACAGTCSRSRRQHACRRCGRPDIAPGAQRFPARLCGPADRLLGRSALGHSTGPRAGLRAGGQSRWSGVSTPPRHDTQVLGRRSTAVIPDRADTGERKARPAALRGGSPPKSLGCVC